MEGRYWGSFSSWESLAGGGAGLTQVAVESHDPQPIHKAVAAHKLLA
jgi:hypothetical protein